MIGSFAIAFVDASHIGWWIVTGCGAAVLIVGLLTTGRWAQATAARTAASLMSDEAKIPASTP
jgi:hypothetical protein